MPQWAGSCWYYLRFIDPTNSGKMIDPEKVRKEREAEAAMLSAVLHAAGEILDAGGSVRRRRGARRAAPAVRPLLAQGVDLVV